MKRTLAAGLTLLIALNAPLAAYAQPRGGRGGGGGGGGFNLAGSGAARSAPAQRPAPIQRPEPAQRPAVPAQRPAQPPNGGNFNRPAQPPNGGNYNRPAQPPNGGPNRPVPPPNNGGGYRPPAGGGGYRPPAAPPANYYRPPGANNYGYYNSYHGTRVVVTNPVYRGGAAWGWNRGVVWYPAPTYWGGGFWGALAIGVTSAAVFGAIATSANQPQVVSYQVDANSPGATLLKNYQLTQVECGPPGLVVIYGPNNSVICANPNNLVAAGDYDLDAQQLSIIAR